MVQPKIIILAQGGTHGDFLYSCGLLMLEGKTTPINDKGRVEGRSKFLQDNMHNFVGGVHRGNKYNFNTDIDLCHIWHEEFIKFSSKFYYINFDYKHIPIIKKMFLAKVCKNDIQTAIDSKTQFLPRSVASKINKTNFDQYWTISLKTAIEKYKQQPNITKIDMIDMYDLTKLQNVLSHMGIFNEDKSSELETMHQTWIEKNSQYIKEILQ